MTGKGFLDALAVNLTALLSNVMEQAFGPHVHTPLFSNVTWADLGVFLSFVLLVLLVNGLASGPNLWETYKESVRVKAIVAESPEMAQTFTDIYQELESVRKSPEGKRIDSLAAQGGDEAIGKIIHFMGDDNDDVSSYASVVLQASFPHQHSSHYDDALESNNHRLLGNVITLMGALHWAEYAPRICDIVLANPDRS